MYDAVVFAGTTEGYSLCRFLTGHGVSVCACTATEYGAKSLEKSELLAVRPGRMTEKEMEDFFQKESPGVVIDATHPYAQEVTKNIRTACERQKTEYLRVLRQSKEAEKEAVYVRDVAEAVQYLKQTEGNVLVTTGSKELFAFTELPGYQKRIFARVLSLPEVVRACADLGLEGNHLICMQGPFSKEMNLAMLRQYDCRYLVTKESGNAGGFEEKRLAAKEQGAVLVIVGRPPEEKGLTERECRKVLAEKLRFSLKPRVSLVGIGMGTTATLTEEGKNALKQAEVVIGAKRMLKSVGSLSQEQICEYRCEEIGSYIQAHPEYERIAVALSGDIGFYSGAKKLLELLKGEAEVICGVSSASYFMGRIGYSWDDAVLASAHGRDGNLVSLIQENKKVFAILGTDDGVSKLAEKLTGYGMGEVRLYVGEQLSYPDEKIFVKPAKELIGYKGDALSVICAVNRDYMPAKATHGIGDDEFIRGKAPMTKEEIRWIALAKLGLFEDSVCFDVGAGTGSVSIEMALRAKKGRVYAIEKKEEAVRLLLENKKKFRTDNLEVISGTAPEALYKLPAPTHAFIGGSAGNLKEIVEVLLQKNQDMTIVITCITLETVSEALEAARAYPYMKTDIVQIHAARAKNIGNYHMMIGENPVSVITIQNQERKTE